MAPLPLSWPAQQAIIPDAGGAILLMTAFVASLTRSSFTLIHRENLARRYVNYFRLMEICASVSGDGVRRGIGEHQPINIIGAAYQAAAACRRRKYRLLCAGGWARAWRVRIYIMKAAIILPARNEHCVFMLVRIEMHRHREAAGGFTISAGGIVA